MTLMIMTLFMTVMMMTMIMITIYYDDEFQVNILDKEDRQVSLPINPDGRQVMINSVLRSIQLLHWMIF